MTNVLKFVFIIFFINTLQYFGLYLKIEGIENIALFIIYIFSIMLLISSISLCFDKTKENKNKAKHHFLIKYLFRLWWIIIILGFVYMDYFLIGGIWTLSTILIFASDKKIAD